MRVPGRSAGDGTANLPASRGGTAHQYVWNSVEDAGTVNAYMLLRFRPLDAKLEVGAWCYVGVAVKDADDNPTGFWNVTPFHLDNYTIFTDPAASLSEARVGSRATLLADQKVLITGGRPTETGTSTNTVSSKSIASTA